jgi:hypothetical protein
MHVGFFKTALISIIILIAFTVNAQSKLFVRVYDINGNKINKGTVIAISDSTLQLGKSNSFIPFKNIGFIKTKHSFGHNSLLGSAISGGIFATVMAIGSTDKGGFLSWTLSEGVAAGLLAGVIYGPVIGGISAIFKNTTTFPINGRESNWKEFNHYYLVHK